MSVNQYTQQVHHRKLMWLRCLQASRCRPMGDCGGGTSAQHKASWRSASEVLHDKGQRYRSQIWKRDVMEQQPDPAGSAEDWAGVVFHSWWPLWTTVYRLLNVSLFTLLTRDTLWTLDNCQQHSTPKTAHKSLLSCLAHSFNGGSDTEMGYLHQTVKRK